MGIFDKAKDLATQAVDQHGEQVGQGIDQAGAFADEKTGGKYTEQINQGEQVVKDQLDALDGQDDDIA